MAFRAWLATPSRPRMCAMDSRPFSDMTETIDTSAIDTVLESVLSSYQLRVEITANVRYCGTWFDEDPENGRASCRENVCQYVLVSGGECYFIKKEIYNNRRISYKT